MRRVGLSALGWLAWALLLGLCCVPPSKPVEQCTTATECATDRICLEQRCVPCPSGLAKCGELCVDLQNHPSHCGQCQKSCESGICVAGSCQTKAVSTGCAANLTLCDAKCTDTTLDSRHCGKCGNACRAGEICVGGGCRCPAGRERCGDGLACVDTSADRTHCGKCGQSCESAQFCDQGRCVAECPSNTPSHCNGGCVDLQSNPLHCGGCNVPCKPGQVCENESCSCPGDSILCNGVCIDPNNNQIHCGKCGNVCPPGQVCGGGKCALSCPQATPDRCLGGCFDFQTYALHCGGCGNACPTGIRCVDGECQKPGPIGCTEDLPCYSGAPDTQGRGSCKEGLRKCINGILSPSCEGEVFPKSETCNNEDDDCDGLIDEDGYCVSLVAGTGNAGFSNAPPKQAEFKGPNGLAVDKVGNLYIADAGNNCIRVIDTQGNLSTFTGVCGRSGFKDGSKSEAMFRNPNGMAFDGQGNMYVADVGNYRIRKVSPNGDVTTLAGSGTRGYGNGSGAAAHFSRAYGVAVDPSGDVYVADSENNAIRYISSSGVVSLFAGVAKKAGHKDGNRLGALFDAPSRLAFDGQGNLYVGDANNQVIRKIDTQGMVTTVAGRPGITGSYNSSPNRSLFNQPCGVAFDQKGRIYVADALNGAIRKIDLKQLNVQRVVGNGTGGSQFSPGPGQNRYIGRAYSIIFAPPRFLYIAAQANNQVYRVILED